MALAHGDAALYLDRIFVVYDPVKDAFGDSAVLVFRAVRVDAVVALICIVLCAKDQGGCLIAGMLATNLFP